MISDENDIEGHILANKLVDKKKLDITKEKYATIKHRNPEINLGGNL